MDIAANKCKTISVFRKAVKKTEKGIHVGIVGDFENCIDASVAIYHWSRIKRKTRPEKLNNLFLSLELRI
jgi:hypothetical protein